MNQILRRRRGGDPDRLTGAAIGKIDSPRGRRTYMHEEPEPSNPSSPRSSTTARSAPSPAGASPQPTASGNSSVPPTTCSSSTAWPDQGRTPGHPGLDPRAAEAAALSVRQPPHLRFYFVAGTGLNLRPPGKFGRRPRTTGRLGAFGNLGLVRQIPIGRLLPSGRLGTYAGRS